MAVRHKRTVIQLARLFLLLTEQINWNKRKQQKIVEPIAICDSFQHTVNNT